VAVDLRQHRQRQLLRRNEREQHCIGGGFEAASTTAVAASKRT
jgi:hypothetical protein